MRHTKSDAEVLKAVREFFRARGHASAARYTRAADGEPMRIFCGSEWCPHFAEIEVTP